jgi:hypothetical protein
MDPDHEAQGIAAVIDRLAERFPGIDRASVESIVDRTHRELEGNPIRDYIPVLVDRTAKDRLRRIAAGHPTDLASV